MDGIILIDKPTGMSSFGVVARARSMISKTTGKKAKVGHAGTLDPFATGLLILLVGKATKQAGEFLKLDKKYTATLVLGKESTTADPEGEIKDISSRVPEDAEVLKVLEKFTGVIQQTPPIFSAIKVGGRRAYDLARKGQEVKLEPRSVTIYAIDNVQYAYPNIKFDVSVSSGTYIRSLAVDIGRELGVGAYLSELRRTSIDAYSIKDATTLEAINPDNIAEKVVAIDK
jgi:tRNA pseudouridine55 synthase